VRGTQAPARARISAPLTAPWQTNSGPMSDSLTSSGHLSLVIVVQWLHL
jgi:hypothetical protein